MNQMIEKYADRSLVIVAVNVDKSREDARAFLADNPARFDIVYDPDGEIAQAFGVKTMPSSFLLDGEGQIVEVHRGFLSAKTDLYEQAILKQLALSGGD